MSLKSQILFTFIVLYIGLNMNENKQPSDDLTKLIDESYGSPEVLSNILDLGIEMLFYLEEDTFEPREVQSVVSAIRGIAGVLREEG